MPAEIPPAMPEKKVYPVIDEGVYQAKIEDVESGKQKQYDDRFKENAPATEPFYVFKFKILTPGPAQGRLQWSKRGSACLPVPPEGKQKPSLVWQIASAVNGSQITLEEGKAWTLSKINELIGKQIILVVTKVRKQDGGEGNLINTYMHAREVLPDVAVDGTDVQSGAPDRYATVPKEFKPTPMPTGDGPQVGIDMPT